jgi:hypothetical protein
VENVKAGLNTALAIDPETFETEEEYKAAVSDSLGQTLEENGIGLTDSQLEIVTDFVIEEMEGVDEVTNAYIAEFVTKYYDAYTSGKLDDVLPDDTEIPEDFEIPEDVEIPEDFEIPDGFELPGGSNP